MPTIQFLQGSLKGQSFEVDEEGATLGSSGRCELQLKDKGVAARHAELSFEEGRWWLRDLRSKTGTIVNDEPAKEAAIGTGDVVGLGSASFRFLVAGETPAEPAAAASIPPAAAEAAPARSSAPAPIEVPAETELTASDKATIDELKAVYGTLAAELGLVIVGQKDVIEEVLISVFCKAHALLVGVPGLAKTLLVSTISEVLELSFKRIQFTPDLMPADITGTEILEEDQATGKRTFKFVHGPLFANMVLADEINRTPPKTQAALLEAMQERHVTIGEQTYDLPNPFFVLATQNPIEQEGTYPLPEAQLDRFMFNIKVGYPSSEEEQAIIKRVAGTYRANLTKQLDAANVVRLQEVVRRVPAADHVIAYASAMARATRPKQPEAPDFVREMVAWGAGPRAGIYLILAAKARAILFGRYHATTQDVQHVAFPVLRHRVITTFNAEAAGVTSDDVIRMLIDHLRPTENLGV
ncbi:MAG: MoxR-like ATPase [Verrucomicrobiales bacterium]|jgi:MoxR-like ATPase